MGFVMGIFFSSLGGPSSMGMPDIDVPHLHALSLSCCRLCFFAYMAQQAKVGWKKQTAEHFKHMGRSGVSMMKVSVSPPPLVVFSITFNSSMAL
jgi:hypothetical protein